MVEDIQVLPAVCLTAMLRDSPGALAWNPSKDGTGSPQWPEKCLWGQATLPNLQGH